jgi:hypothetical protein
MTLAWEQTVGLIGATARVERDLGEGWRARGTAFFVAQRRLLTCAHVIAAGETLRVVWRDGARRHERPVTVVSAHPPLPEGAEKPNPYPQPDVALLEIAAGVDVPDHPTAWLGEPPLGERVWAFGYTDEYMSGVALGNPALFTTVGRAQSDDDGGLVWFLTAERVRGGMSGAPVLDLATGRVVGVLKRTRDSVNALGGWATGMDEVFAVLPDVRTANEQDNPEARAERLAKALWGDLVARVEDLLIDSGSARRVVARQLGLELAGSAEQAARQAARALFAADLATVTLCATRILPDTETAKELFTLVAPCVNHQGTPWVAPPAAAELEQQVASLAESDAPLGRVLSFRSRLPRLRDVYRLRGDRQRLWWPPLSSTPFGHDVDDSGLPADLERELRIAIARRNSLNGGMKFAAAELDEATRAEWEAARPDMVALLRGHGVLGLLACEPRCPPPDAGLVAALVERYPLVFLTAADEEAVAELVGRAEYQELALGIEDDHAEAALREYNAMLGQLEDAG